MRLAAASLAVLGATLTPGTRGTSPVRTRRLAWSTLEVAFQDASGKRRWYVHAAAGVMVEVWESLAEPELWQRYERNPAYLRIVPVRPHEQYVWMERFVADAQLDDAPLAAELGAALRTPATFRSFREIVSRDARLLQRWRWFRRAQTLTHARAWLLANQVVMVLDAPRKASGDTLAGLATVRIRDRFHAATAGMPAEDLAALVRLGEFLLARRAAGYPVLRAAAGRNGGAECSTSCAPDDAPEDAGPR